ncbi:unnamed protein product [Blepharisma stoltei]|uniref:NAD-dependent epimerase/dehydratase domain-containing protein n=1 Tax=Blepharisma stoltei TaxID=1481888 RepID=A0AAU9JT07_9CILI|nr:unnamed protein product [Blepharisma stoltei]
MKIFLTGATGSIGSSVLNNLLSHGHEITCTVRSEEKGQAIASKSDKAHYVLFDIDADNAHQLGEVAAGYDAIIHCLRQKSSEAEDITIDALILAARKTAETKPITLVFTSDFGLNGNTTEMIDEDHDDTSHSFPFSVERRLRERKIINASTENLHGVAIRVCWTYGKSSVDKWIRACKSENKILAIGQSNPYIPFIHIEDLANMYRVLIEERAYGLFFAVEPESLTLGDMIAKVAAAGNIQEVERVDSLEKHISGPYGFFLFGHTINQHFYPKRFIELYDFHFAHKISDWISSFIF